MSAPHVAIVGGGITGLAAAYYLERLADRCGSRIAVSLIERAPALGGKVGTESIDGFLLDTGPDSFLAQKPWAVQLCRELGMGDEIVTPLARRFYMLHDGRLHAVPHELVSLVPTRPEALWRASFLSFGAKLRASVEGLVPARRSDEDESLSSFMRRRFGRQFALRFAEPLMGGVHAGHPERMSMPSIYPMYWDMERRSGSITKAILERRRSSAKSGGTAISTSPFVALRGGMVSLVDRIHGALRLTQVLSGVGVDAIDCEPGRPIGLQLSDGRRIHVDAAILATPAPDAARLLCRQASRASSLLDGIPYASTAVVSLAYPASAIATPLDGSGFLVPRTEPMAITGCTWSSNKWPGRAPDGIALMRAFIGYAGADSMVECETEERLAEIAHGELARVLGISGQPVFRRTHRWLTAMPQYEVGHQARLTELATATEPLPGIILAGSAYRGVGVPDCVRQGKEAAEASMAVLSELPQTATVGRE